MTRVCLGYEGHRCATLTRGASRCDPCRQASYRIRNHTRPQFERALYHSAQWRRLADAVVANAEACTWCGTPASVAKLTADHIVTVRNDPSLALDPGNVVAACQSCQRKRRDRPDVRTWLPSERTPRGASRW